MGWSRAVLLPFALLAGGARIGAQSGRSPTSSAESHDIERFAERLDSLRVAARIPGLAVVVLRDTSVLLARGFGFANLAHGVSVTPETPFNIASVAKTVSATLALRLVERGALDLDRPMRSYERWPEFCADARTDGGIFFRDLVCESETLSLRHLLSMRVNGTPGSRFRYNPPIYSWASRPIMQVTGRSFSELIDSLVLGPAGMRQSARIHRGLPLRSDLAASLATPYHLDSVGRIIESDPPGAQGDGAAGGIVSTAMDLARFDIALSTGLLLTDASRTMMWTAHRAPGGAELPYGLGWFVQQLGGEPLVWHSGLWEGAYSALYLRLPARHLTLILLANSDGLNWDNGLEEAAVERSPFAALFLASLGR